MSDRRDTVPGFPQVATTCPPLLPDLPAVVADAGTASPATSSGGAGTNPSGMPAPVVPDAAAPESFELPGPPLLGGGGSNP